MITWIIILLIGYLVIGSTISATLNYLDYSHGHNIIFVDLIEIFFCIVAWPIVLIGLGVVICQCYSSNILIKGKSK